MRPLKFRFWNKLAKTYKRSWRNAICHDGTFIEWEPEATSYSDPIDFSMSIIVAQQYTGLKDKNEKEIYEGDILKIFNHSQPEQVEYEPNGSGFGFFKYDNIDRKDGTFEFLSHWTGSDGYEVIGNIFENPELLRA